ncbi:MAG TPA: type II toxin-antitoxin system RelE/ParE family toxin [Terracidiphilus sp.]|jgi:proteic killer suppression protein
MIKSFRHAGHEKFYKTDSKAEIQPHHAQKLRVKLTALNEAKGPSDMTTPLSWGLHRLQGGERHWSIQVNGNYRLTFTFDGENAILLDYRDYH